jgi:tellurite resistance protein TerC
MSNVIPWSWLAFSVFVLMMLAIDWLIPRRRDGDPSMAESALSVGFWCFAAGIVGCVVWHRQGAAVGTQFFAGYLLEWSMSVDNVFVFAILFRFFKVPNQYQRTVLFWGIFGAVVMRLAFVLLGAALIERFHYVLPLLGLFLVYTGVRFVWHSPGDIDPRKNLVFRLARIYLPVAKSLAISPSSTGVPPVAELTAGVPPALQSADPAELYGRGFFLRENNRTVVTALFLVVLVIESTDLLFAVDSVPAIFGITRDPFIVFSSNVLAILGLRALYFLLAGALDIFRYLHFGLAAILIFVGAKMIAETFWPHPADTELMPVWMSLVVIGGLLAASIIPSLAISPASGRTHP